MVILKARRFLGYRGGDRFGRRRRLHDHSKTGYCYAMTPERDDLIVVEQRIRAAKEYIYKQERLIERLAAEAKNTDDAFALLNTLNRALRRA
jgi:hypothetical protein